MAHSIPEALELVRISRETGRYPEWSAAEYREKAANKVAAVYKQYFEAPAHSERPPGREYGDQYYHTQARLLLISYMVNAPLYSLPSQAPLWIVPRVVDFPGDVPGPAGRERLPEMAKGEMERCRSATELGRLMEQGNRNRGFDPARAQTVLRRAHARHSRDRQGE